MLHVAIAFKGHHKNSDAETLYTGHDAVEALRVAQNPPQGFATVHVFRNLVPWKRCPVIGGVVAPEIVEEAPADVPPADAPPADAPPAEVAPVEQTAEAPLELASDDKPAAPRRKN
jgi:hypothetical protein